MNVGSLTWDVARAGGLLAYALLAASVAMGLVLSLGWRSPRWTRFVTTEVHRFVTLLSLVFVVIHGTAIALDPFIKMGVPDVLVPFLGPYRPAWVALGIIAAYLALAVYLSERVRGRVGYAWWRRFHALAFVAFAMALMHGIATGSDTRTPWALALYGGSLFLVGFLLILRLFPEEPKRSRPVAAGLAIMAVAGAIGFSLVGPLQPGWNARAGGATATGATSSSDAASATGGGPAATPAPAGLGITVSSPLPFDGTLTQRGTALQVQGQTTDGSGAFLVQLVGRNGSISSGQVVLNTGTGQVCQGDVGAVGNATIDATCSTSDGGSWSLRVAVTQASGAAISGTLEVMPGTGGPAPAGAPGSGTSSG
jgi:hypothetical protein